MVALWIAVAVLGGTVLLLAFKIWSMQRAVREIAREFGERLGADTNVPLSVPVRDKAVCRLALALNRELRVLRRERLRYQNGDRELKEAVTNISHDLRTPLTAICGYLDLLEEQEMTENTRRYVEQIRGRTEALKALTEELFRYSVISSVSELCYERVNVGRVLEDTVLSFYGAFVQKGITPTLTLPKEAVWRTLDKSALSRIFTNIVGNAVKYSDGDFSLTMTNEGEITFSNAAAALSAVEVGKLFDRFYTVDSARSSTGLGLSIAKLLAERMRGEIRAEYKQGVLFVICVFSE